MKREDDQSLWDLLGRGAEPRLSPFFARNILREVRQQRRLFGRTVLWLNWRVATSATAAILAVFTVAFFLRDSASPSAQEVLAKNRSVMAETRTLGPASQSTTQINAPDGDLEMTKTDGSPEKNALAEIDEQDYEVVANLDDLMVLYETTLWDENSSL